MAKPNAKLMPKPTCLPIGMAIGLGCGLPLSVGETGLFGSRADGRAVALLEPQPRSPNDLYRGWWNGVGILEGWRSLAVSRTSKVQRVSGWSLLVWTVRQ